MVTSVVQEPPLTSVHQGMRQFPTCKERAGPSAVPIIPSGADDNPLRQHRGPRAHPAPPRQLAAPPLPRQPRLRLPRHRARSDPSGLLQDDGPTRRLPHQGPSGGRVPRRRRLRVPGLRVRQTLRRLRLPLPSTSPEPPPRDQRPRAAARFPDIPQAQASRFPAEPSQASCFAWRGALIPARSSPRSPY